MFCLFVFCDRLSNILNDPKRKKKLKQFEKERELARLKAEEERKRKEELRRQLIESQKKSILSVSGYIREFYMFEANKSFLYQ